jgi:rhamnosyltransferase
MSAPLLSIILVTRNGAGTLPQVLAAIASQHTDFAFEIVAVDSGSTDGTVGLLEGSVQRLVRISAPAFNHGLTRNLAMEHAAGELAVFLVQDAIPVGHDWLARLAAPLRADPAVAGAVCRQQPHPDASELTRRSLHTWVAAASESRRVSLTAAEYAHLEPLARLRACAFDNVCSSLRRSVWKQIPFGETSIAEDLEWGKAVLLAGHSLAFVAEAVVEHSHRRSPRYEFARTYLLHRRLFELFHLRTIPSIGVLWRALAGSARLHLTWDRDAARTGRGSVGTWRALALAVAWPLGQYLGGLSAARGWKRVRFEGV